MKYLTAEKQTTQYYFLVHTDEAKTLEDGTPDPSYVKEYSYGLDYEGLGYANENAYLDMIKREIGLLVDDELSRMNTPAPAPTPLAGF
jgi:hypothetical protein